MCRPLSHRCIEDFRLILNPSEFPGDLNIYQAVICSSFKFSRATRTASTTKAENVQFVPFIAVSTSSIMSFGNRTLLLVVGGNDGILNFLIKSPRITIIHTKSMQICITNVLQCLFVKALDISLKRIYN